MIFKFPFLPVETCNWPRNSEHHPSFISTVSPSLTSSHCSFQRLTLTSPGESLPAQLHTFPEPFSFAHWRGSPFETISSVISGTACLAFNSETFIAHHFN